MSATPRLVLLLGAAHRNVAANLAHELGASTVVLEQRSLRVKLSVLRARIRRQGLWTVMGQLALRAWLKLFGNRLRGAVLETAVAFPAGCTVLTVHSINSREVTTMLREQSPRVVGVYGTSIIRGEALVALPPNSFNLHTGLTQYFRGMASTFWALEAGHPEQIGVTVHRLSAGVDMGTPVAQAALGYDTYNAVGTMEELDAAVAAAGEKLFSSILKRALADEVLPPMKNVDPSRGVLRTQPTLRQYRRVCRRFKLG